MKKNEYETLINESGGITKEILLVASKLINLPRHISTHPAGIIVSDDDLLDTIPLFSGTNDLLTRCSKNVRKKKMPGLQDDFHHRQQNCKILLR